MAFHGTSFKSNDLVAGLLGGARLALTRVLLLIHGIELFHVDVTHIKLIGQIERGN
jgi:hypothetical protein